MSRPTKARLKAVSDELHRSVMEHLQENPPTPGVPVQVTLSVDDQTALLNLLTTLMINQVVLSSLDDQESPEGTIWGGLSQGVEVLERLAQQFQV